VTTQGAIQVPTSSLVNWNEQPLLLLRKTCLSFVQGLFVQPSNEVGSFRWTPNLEETEIVVTDESPIKLDVVGKRPAISTVRSTAAWGKTSLDEMQERDLQTSKRKHTDLVSGHMTFNCCSREPLETEYIAWVVANHTWLLRRVLIKYTPIHEFGRGQTIGAPTPAGALVQGDTEGEWICTPVSVPFFLQISGTVTPLGLTQLRQLEMELSARLGAQVGPTEVRGQATAASTAGRPPPEEQVNLRPPTIRGRPIRSVAFDQKVIATEES